MNRSQHARAVVTGAGSGIGRAFGVALAARGGEVVCADISTNRAQETVDIIEAAGGRALAVSCDVSVLEQVEKLAAEALEWLDGPLSLVVNNAGVGQGGLPVGQTAIEDWRWTLGVNLYGVIHGCHVFTPLLKANGGGGIVNVASAAAFSAAPFMGAYNVSKAGVMALSETMAAELAGSGVKVTVLCPTFVKTNVAKDGRIDGPSAALAEKLMRWTGVSPESVVQLTLRAVDGGRFYVLPQLDARTVWRLKRHVPRTYLAGNKLVTALSQKVVK